MKLLLRLAVNVAALYVAIAWVPGITMNEGTSWVAFVWLGLIFGLLNALIKPLLTLLTCPLIILTLGFGTFLINMLMFYFAGEIGTRFGVGFTTDGIIPIALGALVVSIVSVFLTMFINDEKKDKKKREKKKKYGEYY